MKTKMIGKTGLIASMLLTSVAMSTVSTPAHALVGLITGTLGEITTGVILMGIDLGFAGRVTGLVGIIGMVDLDSQETGVVQFKALDSVVAAKLGVSDAELTTFNGEVDELNAITATVYSDAAQAQAQGASQKAIASVAQESFDRNTASLSPETLDVLAKIRAAAAQE